MKLKYQRFLYISFFLAFFVIGPLLVTYATGYRYNFKKNGFEKTGVLVASSQPRDADFLLNNELVDTTPAELRYLLPQQYQVEISKAGYHSWKSTVEVRSNETTYISDITLFRDTLPTLIQQGDIGLSHVSPNGRHLLYSYIEEEKEHLMYKALPTAQQQPVHTFNTKQYDTLEFIAWSPQSQKALLKQSLDTFSEYIVFDIQTRTLTNLFDTNRIQFQQLLWDGSNDFLLYGLQGRTLHEINLINLTTRPVLYNVYDTFAVSNGNAIYLTQENGDTLLTSTSLQSPEISKQIKLPQTGGYTLQKSAPNTFTLLDQAHDQLYVVDTSAFDTENQTIDEYILLQTEAVNAIWNSAYSSLLIASEFEISRFDIPSKKLSVITRQSSPITSAQWYQNGQYSFYVSNNAVQVIEASEAPMKNELTLASARMLSNLFNSTLARRIYFTAEIGSQKGLYELMLR